MQAPKNMNSSSIQTSTMGVQTDYKNLAKKYVSEHNLPWGDPVGSGEESGKVYVSFETPYAEKKILGVRVLVIDKNSGSVEVQKRR